MALVNAKVLVLQPGEEPNPQDFAKADICVRPEGGTTVLLKNDFGAVGIVVLADHLALATHAREYLRDMFAQLGLPA